MPNHFYFIKSGEVQVRKKVEILDKGDNLLYPNILDKFYKGVSGPKKKNINVLFFQRKLN